MEKKPRMSKIHRIKCGNGNCYIIENGSNGILVDTGRKEFVDKVMDACKAYPVKRIILTHAHFDHAENAAVLSKTLGLPIGMNKKDCDLIQSNLNQPLSARTLPGKIVLAASLREFSIRAMPKFEPTIWLRDGDSLAEYGVDARIIALPGHTRGSIGIDVDGKHLIVGDVLMNLFYPTVSMLYYDREKMLESAQKISRLGNRMIYSGHGRPMPNRRWGEKI